VDPQRQSVPEAGAYQIVQVALADLRKAERALTIVQEAAPDLERAVHLRGLRTAIAALERVATTTLEV
jgi:hypothetical protein